MNNTFTDNPSESALAELAAQAVAAINERRPEVVKSLLAQHGGGFANAYDAELRLPLHAAAAIGDLASLQALLPHSTNAWWETSNGRGDERAATAMELAIEGGHSECVKALIPRSNPECLTTDYRTMLELAIRRRQPECVKALIPLSDVNRKDFFGRTPLRFASLPVDGGTEFNEDGRAACLAALLESETRPNKRSVSSMTIHAAQWGHEALLRQLLPHANPNAEHGGESALRQAAAHGRAGCVEILLSAGAKPDKASKKGETALHLAAENGHADCVRALLPVSDAGATSGLPQTQTPLMAAAAHGHLECVRALLPFSDAQAKITGAPFGAGTALLRAIECGALDCVRELIPLSGLEAQEQGADAIVHAVRATAGAARPGREGCLTEVLRATQPEAAGAAVSKLLDAMPLEQWLLRLSPHIDALLVHLADSGHPSSFERDAEALAQLPGSLPIAWARAERRELAAVAQEAQLRAQANAASAALGARVGSPSATPPTRGSALSPAATPTRRAVRL